MKKETVIILVIAALALVWYFFFYKKNQTAVIQTPVGTLAAPVTQAGVLNSLPSTNATATSPSQTLTAVDVVSTRPSTGVNPVGLTTIDPSQYDAIILPWMNSFGSANKAQALKMYPSMTDAEKAMLADFIVNLWPGKRAQTADDTAGWNAWRVKYHILDGTYSPFNGFADPQAAYMGHNDLDSAQDAYAPKAIYPLDPVTGSQTALNSFTVKGSGGMAYNGMKGKTNRRK